MTIAKLNRRMYVSQMHGRGIYGKYHRIITQRGTGIFDGLGKTATQYVLGGLGKSSGSYAGKQLGKLIQQKTGSELLGSIAKSGLSSLGGLAGEKLGATTGKLLADTVFDDKKKKKKKPEHRITLSELLDQARAKVMPQSGNGINLI